MIDVAAFSAVVEQHRAALRLHCYRMMGTSHDSDDMVQEALLRAWRARDSLDDRSRAKPWLYRIATNVCLDELVRRSRRVSLASDLGPPSPGDIFPPAPPLEEEGWLEPMPNQWLAGVGADPAARYELRESVALAFVALLQVLSPAQRAALLLRDVVGLSADEAADALQLSVSAHNSALHRARVAIEERVGGRDPAMFAPVEADHPVLIRYARAIADHDIDAMIALIHDEMHTTMPPSPTWIAGYDDNVQFYRRMFARWGDEVVSADPIGLCGGVGFAFRRLGVLLGIETVEVQGGKILRLHHFMQPRVIELFTRPS